MEPAILHKCERCELVFDSPAICCGKETTPYPDLVPSQWVKENIPSSNAD